MSSRQERQGGKERKRVFSSGLAPALTIPCYTENIITMGRQEKGLAETPASGNWHFQGQGYFRIIKAAGDKTNGVFENLNQFVRRAPGLLLKKEGDLERALSIFPDS